MKKTYQNPSTKVVRIEQHLMETVSTIGFGAAVGSAAGAESRRGRGSWEDDEEE